MSTISPSKWSLPLVSTTCLHKWFLPVVRSTTSLIKWWLPVMGNSNWCWLPVRSTTSLIKWWLPVMGNSYWWWLPVMGNSYWWCWLPGMGNSYWWWWLHVIGNSYWWLSYLLKFRWSNCQPFLVRSLHSLIDCKVRLLQNLIILLVYESKPLW